MRIVYGKGSQRVELTKDVIELSWSSTRGQIAQKLDITARELPAVSLAGFLMLFSGTELLTSEQIYHGPIVRWDQDETTGDITASAFELAWYLQKNDISRKKLTGDAGKVLEQEIKATGISFVCPSFGFSINERISSQSYASLFTSFTEQAYEKTGRRYFLQPTRDKLEVLLEGGNKLVPNFRSSLIENGKRGESIEDVYTVVTVERYKQDKLAGSVTKENGALSKEFGRMEKIIDAGEDSNLSSMAASQLSVLSKIPRTRSITVHHEDKNAAKLRAGWLIKITEKDNKTVTDWIVTSCNASWKGGQYKMDLQLERRG